MQPSRQSDDDANVYQLLMSAQSSLYALIYSLLGRAEDVHDVLQDTNLAILSKADEYDASRPFMAWACRFAELQALAYHKRRGRDRLRFDHDTVTLLVEEFHKIREDPSIRLEALAVCLENLAPAQRKLMDEYYKRGVPVSKIAASLGRGVNSIRVSMHRIRKRLLDCIQRRLASEVMP